MFNEIILKDSDSIEDWLRKPTWLLCEALILLKGGNPDTDLYYRLLGTTYDKESSKHWLESFNERQYDTAIRAIKAGELAAEQDESFSGIDSYLRSYVKPKVFLKWAKSKSFPCSHLETQANHSDCDAVYTTPYIEIMKQAIIENKITVDNQDNVESLTSWFLGEKVNGTQLSKRLAKAMATLIRLPESQAGAGKGNKKG